MRTGFFSLICIFSCFTIQACATGTHSQDSSRSPAAAECADRFVLNSMAYKVKIESRACKLVGTYDGTKAIIDHRVGGKVWLGPIAIESQNVISRLRGKQTQAMVEKCQSFGSEWKLAEAKDYDEAEKNGVLGDALQLQQDSTHSVVWFHCIAQ